MYLAYTLGKLQIQKLRDDYRARTGRDLRAFHDAFVAQGGLPVAVQVVGRPWQDHVALAAARCVEAFAPRVPYADPFGPAATLADTPTQEGR